MSKGSTWNIWDFHLHTPYSALNNQFGDPEDDNTWNAYITNVESMAQEKGVVAIAFTDYFTIDGYKRILDYKKRGRLKNVLAMPNIEFRIDKIIYRNKDGGDPKRLNLHVIFSPDVDPREIEEGFLHDLDFYYESEPFDKSKTKKLKPFNLIEFGKSLKAQESRFTGSDFEVGCKTVVVPSEKIKETLDARFHGRHILALADESLSLIEWGSQDHTTRLQLVQMSHVVLSSNLGVRDFCLGKKHDTPKDYLQEFKTFKPCIWGCDSHSFTDRFLEPDEKRYTWVKGEITWEGVKQILYEPDTRIRIQEKNPEHSKSIFTLDQVKIDDTHVNRNLHLSGFNSELNSNLIAIIGGRGSGKTAFLDLLASLFREGYKLSSLENSFYYRLYGKEGTGESFPIPISVEFRSGESYAKNIGEDARCFEKSDVLYLTQNHFDEYSSNPSKLNAYIIELVFEKFPDEKRRYREMEEHIEELEQKTQNINLEIDQLTEEIEGQLDIESNNLSIKKGEQEDFTQRLRSVEEKQGIENDEIIKLTKHQDELKSKKRELESLLYQLSSLASLINDFNSSYKVSVNDVNQGLTSVFGNKKPKLLKAELSDVNSILGDISINDANLHSILTDTEESINKTDSEIGALEGLSREMADLQTKINEIVLEIIDVDSRIKTIIAKQERIDKLSEERFSVYSNVMQRMIELRRFLQETIGKFESGKNELLNHLDFSASVDTNKSGESLEDILEKIDNRVNSPAQISSEYKAIVQQADELMNTSNEQVDFLQIIEDLKIFGSSLRRKKSISLSDLYNTLLQKYFEIGLRIKFGGKDLTELSMGERAVVLLKVLLALDDTPLLIDQPEEHLDNRYIYNELVPAFRKAKTKRQVIIATHNANLVVNTDAEQVIVANYSNGTLSYDVGTLENLSIRDQIKTILEGGDEAFKKREEKYGYIY